MGVDPGGIAVVLVPGVLAPADLVRQDRDWVLDRLTVPGAELLAQLEGAGRTDFHAAAAGHTVFGCDLRRICALGKVGRVEEQRGAQGVADLDVAVADVEDVIVAVDVGDLVNVAVFLGLFQDIEGFFLRDVVSAAGFDCVVGHVADLNAPVLAVVGAALAQHRPGRAAGADTGGEMALVFLQPIGDFFQFDRLPAHLDFLLHRDHMHADAVAAGRHHRGDVLQRQEGHAFKHSGDRRILFDPVLRGIEQLRRTRHKVAGSVALFLRRAGNRAVVVVVVAVVIFHKAVDAEQIEGLGKRLLAHLLVFGKQLVIGVPLALLHRKGNVNLRLGQDLPQAPILLVGGLQAEELVGNIVGDASAELCVFLFLLRFAFVF